MAETQPVQVAVSDSEQTWELTRTRVGRDWHLELVGPSETWTADGPDAFAALRNLRRQLDAKGIRIGVTGALPNAWASGMQRDMGEGLSCYELVMARVPRPPPGVPTFGPAPCELVDTVAAQDDFVTRWYATPRVRGEG